MATPPVPAGPPLGAVLGLNGSKQFLVQHLLFSGAKSYRVLNHEKKHLFTVREDVRGELMANLLNRAPAAPQQGFQFHAGFAKPTTQTSAWFVDDQSGSRQGSITVQMAGNQSTSTMNDSAGAPVIAVTVERSMIGGLKAAAAFPDGRPMFTAQGNLLRHNFQIHGPAGEEVAKIHEAWASLRDTYNLDLVGNVDPLCPLIFAILIDREKRQQG